MIVHHLKALSFQKTSVSQGKEHLSDLEPEMWRELKNIAKRESCTIHDICSLIGMRKEVNSSLTAAIRVFLMLYFRAATTESGHARAGHGCFVSMKKRAGLTDTSSWNEKVDKSSNSIEQTDEVISNRLSPHLSKSERKVNQNSVIFFNT